MILRSSKDVMRVVNAINSANAGVNSLNSIYSSQDRIPNIADKSPEILAPRNVSDTVEVEGPENEVASSSNIDIEALKQNFGINQGFEAGIQPQFAVNSSSGVIEGMEPGMHAGGVFKPPYEN